MVEPWQMSIILQNMLIHSLPIPNNLMAITSLRFTSNALLLKGDDRIYRTSSHSHCMVILNLNSRVAIRVYACISLILRVIFSLISIFLVFSSNFSLFSLLNAALKSAKQAYSFPFSLLNCLSMIWYICNTVTALPFLNPNWLSSNVSTVCGETRSRDSASTRVVG